MKVSSGAAVVAAVLSAASATAQDDALPSREMIIAGMVSEGATEEQANCFMDTLGDDAIRILGALEPDPADDAVLEAALAACATEDGQ